MLDITVMVIATIVCGICTFMLHKDDSDYAGIGVGVTTLMVMMIVLTLLLHA